MNNLTNITKINFSWTAIGRSLLSVAWQLLVTTVIFWLISRIGKKLINHYFINRQTGINKRSKTIASLTQSIFYYSVLFFYLFGVLSILGVPVGTLLASAGIFSLALGMGAQGFVSDLVNGFFILSEDQYNVGDLVKIGTETGKVQQLGLRTTRLQMSDGSLIYIPNRNISVVYNLTHGGTGLNIELQLAVENDFDQVKNIIMQVNRESNAQADNILTEPAILGIIAQNHQAVTYAIHFQIKPWTDSAVRNYYFSRYLSALKKAGVEFAPASTAHV